MTLSIVILCLLMVWNLAVMMLFGVDKLKAKKGSWRVPEKTLLTCAFCLGSAGAFVGMHLFHHKTQHMQFEILIPLFLLLHAVLAGYLLCTCY